MEKLPELTLKITCEEFSAISDIYGPPSDVHSMIMTAKEKADGWQLCGDKTAFGQLAGVIEEDLIEGMTKRSNRLDLLKAMGKTEALLGFVW